MKYWLGAGTLIAAFIIAAQFVTVFVIQPIGAVPDGRTVIITRLTNLNFVDSADAVCERKLGGVSLFCRGAVMGRIAHESRVLLRLPYSETLYSISTGGKNYER